MKFKRNYVFVKKTKRMRVKLNNTNFGQNNQNHILNYNQAIPFVSIQNSNVNYVSRRNSVASVTLSWEYINVFSKYRNKLNCCNKNKNGDSDSNLDSIPSYELQSDTSNDSLKNVPHQILNNGTIISF
jgi:hypothetical protein